PGVLDAVTLVEVCASDMAVFSARRRLGFDSDQRGLAGVLYQERVWQPISSAPFDRDLELAVIDHEGPPAPGFASRRILSGWINAETKQRIDVQPTHWREWGAKD